MKNLGFIKKSFIGCICFILAANSAYAQDTTWQQVLGGWVDDVYYENLFLGGLYYTRISLTDIDDDGDLDMFYGGGSSGSIIYFENIGDYQNPSFELELEEFPALRHPSIHGSTADVDFADLDNDGDFDAVFSTHLDMGGLLLWNDGSPENPDFIWRYPLGPNLGQSNPTLVDIDADGDFDYFGGYGYQGFQLFFCRNIGTPEIPQYQTISHNYQNLNFGIPFNFDMADLDNDGDFDLMVCEHGGSISYYENTGTCDSAYFTLITSNYFPNRDTTDWLESPEFADIDGDNDLDLFLAGGYAHLFYFENAGTPEIPDFILQYDTSFFYVFASQAGAMLGNSVDIDADGDEDIFPGRSILLNGSHDGEIRYLRLDNELPFVQGCFVDLDNDNDYDFITPGGQETIGFYENIGDSSWPVFAPRLDLFPPDGHLSNIWVVATGDLDNDGDHDLIVGHSGSYAISFYRNIGTPQNYIFDRQGILDLPDFTRQGYFDIALEDIDLDNDLDLLIGDIAASDQYGMPVRLMFYRNDGTPQQPVWTFVTDDFQNIIHNHRNGGITVCLSDAENDGSKDLFLSVDLGLQLYLNPVTTDIYLDQKNQVDIPETDIIECYPNPFNSAVTISVANASAAELVIEIYDILGRFQESLSVIDNQAIWDASGYSSGVYFARVKSSGNTAIRKLLYLK
jgi:hypothetical protein